MSALAAAKTPNPTNKSLTQAETDLRAEAVAIEKLRKQIQEGGSKAPKQMVAVFAKRQKAFLDQKILLEKQKRGTADAPSAPDTKPAETRMALIPFRFQECRKRFRMLGCHDQ